MAKRKTTGSSLLQCERYLLETGQCVPDKIGSWSDYNECWLRPFQLVSPAGREDLIRLWLEHRDTLLSEWCEQGRKGLPWAAREFD